MPKRYSPPKNDEVKVLRAIKMLERKVENASLSEIAKEFGTSPQTVSRYLRLAQESDIISEMRSQVMAKLMPRAIAFYEKLFDMDPSSATIEKTDFLRLAHAGARDIAFGTSVLRKEPEKVIERQVSEISLERYFEQNPEPKQLMGEVIDGT